MPLKINFKIPAEEKFTAVSLFRIIPLAIQLEVLTVMGILKLNQTENVKHLVCQTEIFQ